MFIKTNKVFHELEISDIDTDARRFSLLTGQENPRYDPGRYYLNIYTSLMASPVGKFTQSLNKDQSVVHRFDWQFGISTPMAKEAVFDWVGALREDRSICIQVLMESPDPECECLVISADMNGFKPLNTMKDGATNYLSLAGSLIGGLSPVPLLSKAMGLLTDEVDRKDAVTYENRFKNMFRLFRFLTDTGNQGLEYVLTKDVLAQWGTFLRGSFELCFMCNSPKAAPAYPYRITLLPKLGFKKNDHLCFFPSPQQQDHLKSELVIHVGG